MNLRHPLDVTLWQANLARTAARNLVEHVRLAQRDGGLIIRGHTWGASHRLVAQCVLAALEAVYDMLKWLQWPEVHYRWGSARVQLERSLEAWADRLSEGALDGSMTPPKSQRRKARYPALAGAELGPQADIYLAGSVFPIARVDLTGFEAVKVAARVMTVGQPPQQLLWRAEFRASTADPSLGPVSVSVSTWLDVDGMPGQVHTAVAEGDNPT